MRVGSRQWVFVLGGLLFALPLPSQSPLDLESFEKVWTTVRDRHWQERPGGLDWQAIRAEFRPKAENAATIEAMRAVVREMLARLGQTHFGIVPGSLYALLAEGAAGDGTSGIDLRVSDGAALVTGVDPGSSAEKAGVKPGWQIASVNGVDLQPLIAKAAADSTIHEMQLTRSLAARLSGPPGRTLHVGFVDGSSNSVVLDLTLGPGRGEFSVFGNLPPQRVWFESRRIAETLYIRFNAFLDLPRVMSSFQNAVEGCRACAGLVLDLRGNPGGIGGMAMGMAGFLIDKPDQKLGTMYMRDTTLKFVVNPRPRTFDGPVAVLVDGLSASTSEILAGGLKDLGRARIFGTRTAAAALPSNFEKLPNGDVFQFAVANYISEGGKPLEGLGVSPDVEVRLTREALLDGRDPVLEAALTWIETQKETKR
jgi:carboxyl-terminal processing protease